jgi:Na+-transporting methylmalonyl-CoA/oxaloacetate decarboxylase gamma subunit
MSVSNSLLVASLVMGIVFVVLIVLSFLLKAQSTIFSFIAKKKDNPSSKVEIESSDDCHSNFVQNSPEVSKGQLDLIGVDEKTAAIIMAIVSDELKISLNQLQFKSIKSLD